MTPATLLLVLLLAADDPKPAARPPKAVEVVNQVEGRTVILMLVPEGEMVAKGQVVVELDSAALRNALIDQQIGVLKAEADATNAVKTREVAEIVVQEEAAVLAQDVEIAGERVKLANTGMSVAEAKVAEAKKLKIATKKSQAEAARVKAEVALKAAQGKVRTLKEVDGPARIREANLALDRARTDETARVAIEAQEKAKEKKIQIQIDRCTIKAPIAGRVFYSNPKDPGLESPPIEEGATIRERQAILRIVPG